MKEDATQRTKYNFVELAPTCSWMSAFGMYHSCSSVSHSDKSFRRSWNVAVRVSPGLSSFSLSKPRSQMPSLPGIVAYCRAQIRGNIHNNTDTNQLGDLARGHIPRVRHLRCHLRNDIV